ncbi:hypothetical protein CSB08_00030 [Candidatus Gracilibacteria bacterium]|nr:MAG: hypothetical protein CSB08_00030 [Candidatus Gracilibacteria bacterium]PIE85705.1 MAG: hypothetical protein CSA08_00710 [Candidatus Gracilibacteria bacterium]
MRVFTAVCFFVFSQLSYGSLIQLNFQEVDTGELFTSQFDDGILPQSAGPTTFFGPPVITGGYELVNYGIKDAVTILEDGYYFFMDNSYYDEDYTKSNSGSIFTEDPSLNFSLPLVDFLNSALTAEWYYLYGSYTGFYQYKMLNFTDWEYVNAPPSQVSAPATLALLGCAGAGLLLRRRKQKSK